jgi:hypothetical protein
MIWEILADLLMKFLLFRKALERFRTYHHLCLIKLFILYESLHTGICLRFNVALHSEQTFHITVTPWWTLPFHYVRQVLLLIFFHILDLEFILALNWLCGFWTLKPTSEVVTFALAALESYLHTHTHTHTQNHRSRKQVSVTSWQCMFFYFRCVSFIEEWWWREVSFSIH